MKTLFITFGLAVLLAVLRLTGVWELPWVWIAAPVWGPLIGAVGLVVWVKCKTK